MAWKIRKSDKIRGYKRKHTFTKRTEDKRNDNNNNNNNNSGSINNNNVSNSDNNKIKTKKKIEGHNQGEEIKENSIVLLIKSLQRNN